MYDIQKKIAPGEGGGGDIFRMVTILLSLYVKHD